MPLRVLDSWKKWSLAVLLHDSLPFMQLMISKLLSSEWLLRAEIEPATPVTVSIVK